MYLFHRRLRVFSNFLNRQVHNENKDLVKNLTEVVNRNPRNLELMTIARKPAGYGLEKPGRNFWHRLIITRSVGHITAEIHHFENGVVLAASSKEWAIKKHLYRTYDIAAYINVGRVLAQRCLECGIYSFHYQEEAKESQKVNSLIQELEKGGLVLKEPDRYMHPLPWALKQPSKPWEVHQE